MRVSRGWREMSVRLPMMVAAGEGESPRSKVQSERRKRNIEHPTLNIEHRSLKKGENAGNGERFIWQKDLRFQGENHEWTRIYTNEAPDPSLSPRNTKQEEHRTSNIEHRTSKSKKRRERRKRREIHMAKRFEVPRGK